MLAALQMSAVAGQAPKVHAIEQTLSVQGCTDILWRDARRMEGARKTTLDLPCLTFWTHQKKNYSNVVTSPDHSASALNA